MIPANLLIGERARLTALTEDDMPTLAAWHEHTEFRQLFEAGPAHPKTAAQLSTWLAGRHQAADGFVFAIRAREGREALGVLELDGILWTHQNAWIGIVIGAPENWGQGYGAEAMRLALRFAFEELNLHRVQLTVFSYNTRAIALYEKLGFRREGVYREHLQRGGERHDMLLYGLLRREWEALQ
jgi:RimJ/RimL family protein N-acetyltransferase